jgi:glycosyltransferase involved in cell wall biosynthesis
MGEEPRVSVVIPAYNSVAFIERTLGSVYTQTYPNLEVIVVDDGSTDETAAIVATNFPQAKLICQENQGKPAAVGRGVEESSGEYLAPLDHDDEWFPNKIERQVETMRDHPGLAVLICQPLFVPASGNPVSTSGTQHMRLDGRLRPVTFYEWFTWRAAEWTACNPSGWLLRKKTLLDLGGFADVFPFDDWDFMLRATGRGYAVAVLCEPLYYYHCGHPSPSRPRDKSKFPVWRGPEMGAAYDPRGDTWKARLLDEREYCTRMEWAWLRTGRRCWQRGHLGKVPEMFHRADEMARRLGRWHYLLFRARLIGQYVYSFVRAALSRRRRASG